MKTDDIYTSQFAEEDWQKFKAIRLEALSSHSDLFGASYDVDASKDDQFWKDSVSGKIKGAVFGLYDRDDVIGLTGIYYDWNGLTDTAILIMSYIRKEYRGQGLSDLLYKARIDWAKAQGDIKTLMVAHREGNDASRGANQRWGFKLSHVKDEIFGNGETAKDYIYELKI